MNISHILHRHRHTHTYIHTDIHTDTHTYMHACMHTNKHTYIHTYVCTYIHTYIRTYVHTYIHSYIHVYIYTYIHTYVGVNQPKIGDVNDTWRLMIVRGYISVALPLPNIWVIIITHRLITSFLSNQCLTELQGVLKNCSNDPWCLMPGIDSNKRTGYWPWVNWRRGGKIIVSPGLDLDKLCFLFSIPILPFVNVK